MRDLLYLHPAGGGRRTPFLDAMAKTHVVHMPAFPRIDGIPPPEDSPSGRALALAVADYAEKFGKPVDVLGCSSSGAVALWLAIERPQLIDHLVLEAPGEDPALLERLGEVRQPTLILHGTEDRTVVKESMQLLKSRLPRAFLVYVWDAAHDIEVDQPERMLALVRSFLERSDAFMVNR